MRNRAEVTQEVVWWQDVDEFMSCNWTKTPESMVSPDDHETPMTSTIDLPGYGRVTFTERFDFGPVCGLEDGRYSVCSLPPGHECPHLACAPHFVRDLGLSSQVSIQRPRVTAHV